MGHHAGIVEHRDQRPQVVLGTGDGEQRAGRPFIRIEVLVVRHGREVGGLAEQRVVREIIDPLALEVRQPAVPDRVLVLLAGQHVRGPPWSSSDGAKLLAARQRHTSLSGHRSGRRGTLREDRDHTNAPVADAAAPPMATATRGLDTSEMALMMTLPTGVEPRNRMA